jgi:hypothetical protein
MLFLKTKQFTRSFTSSKKECYKERSRKFTVSRSRASAIYFIIDVGRMSMRKFLKEHRQRILDSDRDWHGDSPKQSLKTGCWAGRKPIRPLFPKSIFSTSRPRHNKFGQARSVLASDLSTAGLPQIPFIAARISVTFVPAGIDPWMKSKMASMVLISLTFFLAGPGFR